MNIEFRRVTSGPFAGATIATLVEPDRPDEEQRLRQYLADAIAKAEANGGWGEKAIADMENHVDEQLAEVDRVAPFEIGDTVKLNSGSPRMTVEDIEYCPCCDEWFIDTVWYNTPESRFDILTGADARLFEVA